MGLMNGIINFFVKIPNRRLASKQIDIFVVLLILV
jgi:hypothetical protein